MNKCFFFLFFCTLFNDTALADYIVNVQRSTAAEVSPGQSVSFDIILSVTQGTSFDLKDVQTSFDIHAVGSPLQASVPTGIGSIVVSNYLSEFDAPVGATNPDFNSADGFRAASLEPNFDFGVNTTKTTPGSLPLNSGTLYTLFRVTVNTGSMSNGSYELVFQNKPGYLDPVNGQTDLPDPPFVGIGDIGGLSNLSTISSQFTIITAVPEPSSLALVGLVSLGMCLTRRRGRWSGS